MEEPLVSAERFPIVIWFGGFVRLDVLMPPSSPAEFFQQQLQFHGVLIV